MKTTLVIALGALAAAPVGAAGPKHFEIEASFERAAEPSDGPTVAIRFAALDPDVNVNEFPAPRLRLDDQQALLRARPEKTAVAASPPPGDGEGRYLDLSEPVRFPVELSADVPAGFHGISAEVIYFYCSTSQGWCRRGTETVTIPILVSR